MRDSGPQRARTLVLQHGWNAVSYQLLNPGMHHWFSAAGDAVVGWMGHGRTRVVAGAPVCAHARLEQVAHEFEQHARDAGERVIFFAAGARLEQVMRARGDRAIVAMGSLPVWDPLQWDGLVRSHAHLRAQLHRARNKGVHITEWQPARATSSGELRDVLAHWLARRGLPPMSFLVMPDVLDTLEDRRIFVAQRHGDVVAYLVATPVPARGGWLVEQWPRVSTAPNGTTHLLVDAAMRAFADAGSRYATLGLAPLSMRAFQSRDVQPTWLRLVLQALRAHGSRYYNFRGLDAFKAGMQPAHWEPVYAIGDGPRFTPRTLYAIAGVFSGGAPVRFVLHRRC